MLTFAQFRITQNDALSIVIGYHDAVRYVCGGGTVDVRASGKTHPLAVAFGDFCVRYIASDLRIILLVAGNTSITTTGLTLS
ncbi:unnamed protein product, partial [Brenthis ino]